MTGSASRSRSSLETKAGTTSDIYATVGSAGSAPPVNLLIPTGRTKNFIVDYISVCLQFSEAFGSDPVFFLIYTTGGIGGHHAFSAVKIARVQAPQLYVISCLINIAVDAGTSVTFQGEFMPADISATVEIHLSGHFA